MPNQTEYRARLKYKLEIKYKTDLSSAVNDRSNCNYFSNERIAVYTCIIGRYDELIEPCCKPDNIDYFAITDFDLPENSLWKRIDPNDYIDTKDMTASLVNRFFKMKPFVVFPNYKYSIYVDGNFRIISDFTEHVNRISSYGMAHFLHSKRTSVYKEAELCYALEKETKENLDNYCKLLRYRAFPEDYGLLACNIIVREHNLPLVQKVMNEWWEEFKTYLKRDQISLPYVLYKNHVTVADIATLGGDVHKDCSFEIKKHTK